MPQYQHYVAAVISAQSPEIAASPGTTAAKVVVCARRLHGDPTVAANKALQPGQQQAEAGEQRQADQRMCRRPEAQPGAAGAQAGEQ